MRAKLRDYVCILMIINQDTSLVWQKSECSREYRVKSDVRQPHHGSAIRRPHRTMIVEEAV